VALRGTGRAVRPSAEHGRPEVRLIYPQAPVSSFQHEAQRRGRAGPAGAESWSLARLASCRGARGSRCSGFWAGRLGREGGRDELACPTRGQTDIGGRRMTGPQRRPAKCDSESLSVSGARTGDAVAGVVACLGGFPKWSAMESEGGIAHGAWGQCRSCRWRRGGGAPGCGAEWSGTKWKADKSGAPVSRARVLLFTVLRTA